MSSRHAIKMQEQARALIWRSHAEDVSIVEGGSTRTVEGIWKRAIPDGAPLPEGIGAQEALGRAMVTVKVEQFPNGAPGPLALIPRNGEDWRIEHIEPQDEWTWIFHLARPDADVRMPARQRR